MYKVYLKFIGDTYEDNISLGNGVHSVDLIDMKLLEEVVKKFMISDSFSREKIYKQIVKEETVNLDDIDLFYHLENQSFDFLDHIDTQEIISHIEAVGYYVTESSKY